jgi:hypothetical protein
VLRVLASLAIACSVASASPTKPCLPKALRDAPIVKFEAHGNRARVCYGESSRYRCLVVDARGEAIREVPYADDEDVDAGVPSHPFELEELDGFARVCRHGTQQCRQFATGLGADVRPIRGMTNDDGTLVFLLEKQDDTLYGDLYATITGARLAHVKLHDALDANFDDSSTTRGLAIVGMRVVIGSYPAGPGGVTAVLDPFRGTGRLLGGGPDDVVALDATTLLSIEDHELMAIDLRTLAATEVGKLPGKTVAEDFPSTAIGWVGGAIVIAYAGAAGTITFDPATRKLRAKRTLPICP